MSFRQRGRLIQSELSDKMGETDLAERAIHIICAAQIMHVLVRVGLMDVDEQRKEAERRQRR